MKTSTEWFVIIACLAVAALSFYLSSKKPANISVVVKQGTLLCESKGKEYVTSGYYVKTKRWSIQCK